MIKVAITGQMGSGKTFISNTFKSLGVPLYLSDLEVKRLQNENVDLKKEIKELLGNVYLESGEMDRKKVRELTLLNNYLLKELTDIVMPYALKDFEKFCETHKDSKIILAESAILFETGFDKKFDKIIYVSSDKEKRKEMAIKRDGISEEEYDMRMSGQIDDGLKITKSDYIIENDFTDNVVKKVIDLFKRLNEINNEKNDNDM